MACVPVRTLRGYTEEAKGSLGARAVSWAAASGKALENWSWEPGWAGGDGAQGQGVGPAGDALFSLFSFPWGRGSARPRRGWDGGIATERQQAPGTAMGWPKEEGRKEDICDAACTSHGGVSAPQGSCGRDPGCSVPPDGVEGP